MAYQLSVTTTMDCNLYCYFRGFLSLKYLHIFIAIFIACFCIASLLSWLWRHFLFGISIVLFFLFPLKISSLLRTSLDWNSPCSFVSTFSSSSFATLLDAITQLFKTVRRSVTLSLGGQRLDGEQHRSCILVFILFD